MRMQTRGNIPSTTKIHFKLYKAGKLWLVAGLTSIAMIAGLGFTTAQAATDDASSQDQDLAPSGQVSRTGDDESTIGQGTNDIDNSVNKPAGNGSASDELPATTDKSNTDKQSGPKDTASKSQESGNDGSSQGLSGAASATQSGTTKPATYAEHITPTAFDLADVPTAPTAKTGADSDGNVVTGTAISTVPVLGDFYVNVTGGGYIPYDAEAMVGLVPYDAENFTTFPQDVFGFYVILPETITADLRDVQTGADNYVAALRATIDPNTGKPYVDITSLTVYRLKDTNDGRQVYYFKPNEGATFTAKQPGMTGYSRQIHMYTKVSTGKSENASTEPTTITFNNPDGKNGSLPIHDVLFMGIGDQTYNVGGDDYIGYNAVDAFGSNAEDWPDTKLVSIYADNGAASKSDNFGQLTYVKITVTDKFQIYLPTDSTGKTAFQHGGTLDSGNPGDTYDLTSKLATFGMSKARYWLNSLQYVGYSSSNYTPQTLPATATLEPTSLDLAEGTTTAPGKTYNFFISLIKTALSSKDATYYAGPKNGWQPADTLTGIAPDGSVLDVDGSLDPNSQVAKDLGTLALTITDAAGQVVTQDQLTKPGTYTVKYTYTDIQDNIGSYQSGPAPSTRTSTVATATITVLPTASSLSTTDKTITAGDSWTPADNITTLNGVDGNSADIAAALAGTNSDGSKATMTITNSKGETVDPAALDLKTPATYQLAYTYTDANGNTITSEQVSLTIKAPVNNGGTIGTITNPTTPNQPTMPAKPTVPGNPIRDPTTGKTPAKVTKTPHTTTKRHPRTTTGKLAATGYPTTTGTTQRTATNFNGSPATFVTDSRRPSSSNSSTRLPQTGEQADAWVAELGLVLLALTSSLALRRKQD